MTELNDQQLLREFAAGSEAAFVALVARHGNLFHSLAALHFAGRGSGRSATIATNAREF